MVEKQFCCSFSKSLLEPELEQAKTRSPERKLGLLTRTKYCNPPLLLPACTLAGSCNHEHGLNFSYSEMRWMHRKSYLDAYVKCPICIFLRSLRKRESLAILSTNENNVKSKRRNSSAIAQRTVHASDIIEEGK